MKKIRRLRKRLLSGALLLLIGASVCFAALRGAVSASEQQSLTIKVQYAGIPCEVTKATYSQSNIRNSGYYINSGVLYTFMDSANRLRYAYVTEGIYLVDLLNNAGVSTGDVTRCSFSTQDGRGDKDVFDAGYLFAANKAYPEACNYYTWEGYPDDEAKANAQDSAIDAYTMISLQDNTAVIGEEDFGSDYNPQAYIQKREACFRLMIGQRSLLDRNAGSSLQSVYEIKATYAGAPTIQADAVTVKKGKTAQISAGVESKEQTISQYVADRLSYSSKDNKIATVDENGVVTGVREGTTEITISYKRDRADAPYINRTITVTVGDTDPKSDSDESGKSENPHSGDGDGDGKGSGTGDGTGTSTSGDGDGNGLPGNGTGGNGGTQEVGMDYENTTLGDAGDAAGSLSDHIKTTQSGSTTLTVRRLGLVGNGGDSSGDNGGEQGALGGGGKASAKERLPMVKKKGTFPIAAVLGTFFLFAGGGVGMFINYKREF